MHYLLGPDGRTPEPFDIGPNMERLTEWAVKWERQRPLAEDAFPCGGRVSTAFLGIDHGMLFAGPPLVFETMAFDAAGKDVFQHRETTYQRAMKTHHSVLEHVMKKATP